MGLWRASLPYSSASRFATLHAADPDAAFAWYRDVLGLPAAGGAWFKLGDGPIVSVLDE